MNDTLKFLVSLAVGAVVVFVGVSLAADQPLGGGVDYNRFVSVSTSTSKSVTTSDTLIMATTTARCFLELANDSAFTVYLSFGSDKAAVAGKGIELFASTTRKIDQTNLYVGAIHGIAVGGTANVLLTEAICN